MEIPVAAEHATGKGALGFGTPVLRTTAPIADAVVREAGAMLDRSPLLGRIETWKNENRSGPGGRPEEFPTRALLVAMVVVALTGDDMLVTDFCEVLFCRISPEMRAKLGVPHPPNVRDEKGWKAVYRNVRTRFHGLLGLMDPSPTPKNRRLDPVTFAPSPSSSSRSIASSATTTRSDRIGPEGPWTARSSAV